MTSLWPAPIEQAFNRARRSDAPLCERLHIIADVVASEYPDFTETVETFVGRLQQASAGTNAPEVGESMPAFVLPDQDGHLVSMEDMLADGPLVVSFHRGHWCPYCRLNMVALAEIQDRIFPARVVAISPETQHYTRLLKEDTGANFPFLTDFGAAYALSLNLAVWVDLNFSRLIAESGCDVPLYNGTSSWIIPIPAVFIVGRDGIVADRHIDPDYRRRMEIDALMNGVEKVL